MLPLLYLGCAAVELAIHLTRLAGMDGQKVAQLAVTLDSDLGKKRGLALKVVGGKDRLEIDSFAEAWTTPLPLKKKTIVALGASTLVWPSKEVAFPAMVEKHLKRGGGEEYQVANLGKPGIDSFTVRNFGLSVLKLFRPALVMIYTGHNDFSFAYTGNKETPYAIRRAFYVVKDSMFLERMFWPVKLLKEISDPDLDELDMMGYMDMIIEPQLLNYVQQSSVMELPATANVPVDRVVAKHYKKNIQTLIKACRERGIPVLIMTVLSNLGAPVHGPVPMDRGAFQELTGSPLGRNDPRLASLLFHKDRDMFSYDIRAKSIVQQAIRGMAAPGVHVLDLEKRYFPGGFDFEKSFEDRVHFTPLMHERVARTIVEEIRSKGLLGSSEGGADTPGGL